MPKDFTFYLTRKSTFEKIMVVFKNGVLKLWSQTKYFIVLLFTLRMLSVFKLRCVLIWTGRAAWLRCLYGYCVYFPLEHLHILWVYLASTQISRHYIRSSILPGCVTVALCFQTRAPQCLRDGNCRKFRVDTWPSLTVANGSKRCISWPLTLLPLTFNQLQSWYVSLLGEMEGPLSVQIISSRLNMPEDGESRNPVSPLWPAQCLCSSSDLRP